MNHPNQHLYPIIDDEFNTRFFATDLVDAVIDSDKQFCSDPFFIDLAAKRGETIAPMDWDSMSLRDQILSQIGFVAPPPRHDVSVEDELSSDEKWANEVLTEIERINAVHAAVPA